jgi:tripartite ATP-independent transporter DctP family solute receptor
MIFKEKIYMKRIVLLFVACCAGLLTACSVSSRQENASASGSRESLGKGQKIIIQHVVSLANPWQKGAEKLAGTLNAEGFAAEVFGNGVLSQNDWKLMFEQTQSGANDIAIESVTSLTSIVPEIFAINLPFFFQDQDHLDRFLQSDSKIISQWEQKFEEKNLVILAMCSKPFRQIINNKLIIKKPADIAGLKFRVPDTPTFVKVFETMGAKPVALPGGEIYSAIQLGTVVGQDNSVPNVYDFKTHEVAKYMTLWNYMGDGSVVVMNKKKWDALSSEQQQLFKKAGQEFVTVNLAADKEYYNYAMDEMRKSGVEFYNMPDNERKAFADLMGPVYQDFAATIGQQNWETLIAEVNALKK